MRSLLPLFLLASCGASAEEEEVFYNGGLWEVSTELSEIDFPNMAPADQRALFSKMRALAPSEPERVCWPAKTRANYLRAGDIADIAPSPEIECRYTAVEAPGDPVARTTECKLPNGTIDTVTTARGQATPTNYSYEIVSTKPNSPNRVLARETGRWISSECPAQ